MCVCVCACVQYLVSAKNISPKSVYKCVAGKSTHSSKGQHENSQKWERKEIHVGSENHSQQKVRTTKGASSWQSPSRAQRICMYVCVILDTGYHSMRYLLHTFMAVLLLYDHLHKGNRSACWKPAGRMPNDQRDFLTRDSSLHAPRNREMFWHEDLPSWETHLWEAVLPSGKANSRSIWSPCSCMGCEDILLTNTFVSHLSSCSSLGENCVSCQCSTTKASVSNSEGQTSAKHQWRTLTWRASSSC